MKTLVKGRKAKRFCCYAKKFQGLGMGMGTWVPQCGMEEYNEKFKCCKEAEKCCAEKKEGEEGCGKEARGKCWEAMKKAMEEPDEFTKKILDCPCVPEYIKKCPFFLMMFKAEIIRCHAKQSLAAYRMKESLCCGKCCCETQCKKECPCGPECKCDSDCKCRKE
eukprot:gnl/Chilomastix_caulleri/592.p1 GENE.gnl/Chilomastix_caulleri/592~~gnl/Chilomastix_caulleri/592.p1  ORF type:complete len:164 (-),score=69.66 gnl/Chilomastix_caulleri/592:80-571(-)